MPFIAPVKEKLGRGDPVLGLWSIIPSPMMIEVFAMSGLDFLILDMEHGLHDVALLDNCIRACEAGGASALVRTPGLHHSATQWALDSGAHGIVVPQVEGVSQARQAVQMCKFAPNGTRGYNPFTRAGDYGRSQAQGVSGKLHNSFGLCAVIVENQTALDDLDSLCALPDLDVIYIGVYDLSVALGFQGDTQHKHIQSVLTHSVKRIRQAGKAAGMMVRNQVEVEHAISLGANFLVHGVDTSLIQHSTQRMVESFKCLSN
jgi:4-hydroxy-2-oxoheptanedioate aldolase